MALEAFIDSKYPLEFCSMTPTQVTGDLVQSSNSDNVQQEDNHFQDMLASLFSSSSGNILGVSAKIPHPNMGVNSSSTSPTPSNSLTDLGLSVGTSSSFSRVNPAVVKRPMYRTGIADIDRLNLPALPLFSSYNSSISGSSTISDLSVAQLESYVGQNCTQVWKTKCQQGCFSTNSHSKSQNSLLNTEKRVLITSNEMCKRPRLDIKQQLQTRDYLQLQSYSPLLETLIQQHKLENQKQQKMLQSVPELQGVDLKNQKQQQMRDYLEQLASQQVQHMHPFNSNICSRRLSQYMYHLQHRPLDNSISYWKKFVAEYYAPCAKKRWCLSLCDNVTLHAISAFPHAAMETWQCELCSTKSGKGFEATFEVLPRLNKIQFESGVIDELLFLEFPWECRLPSGLMMLEYGKAVHETIFDQFRVVHEGKLRIIFTLDLKILSWEFCSRDHEELLHRSVITSQVNEFVHAAQKYQTVTNYSGSDKISTQDLEHHAMLLSSGCKLEKKLNLQLVEELGFSKRYIRCLQIADIFTSMKDLMTSSWENKIGPIESLKNYSKKITITKFQKDEFQEKEKLEISQGMPTDATKSLSTSHGLSSNGNDNSNMSKDEDGLLTSSEKAALAHPGDYCKLLRQTSINSNVSKLGEPSCQFKWANNGEPFQGPNSLKPEFSQIIPCSSSPFPKSIQNTQDNVIQKLLLEMVSNSKAVNQNEKEAVNHPLGDVFAGLPTNAKGTCTFGNAATSQSSASVETSSEKVSRGVVAKKSGFKAASFIDSSKECGSPSFIEREPTQQKKFILPEFHNMFRGLKENEIAKVIHGGSIGYDWKT